MGVEDRETKWREVNPASLRFHPHWQAQTHLQHPTHLLHFHRGFKETRGQKVEPQPAAERPQPTGWEVEGGEVQVTGLPKATTDALGG